MRSRSSYTGTRESESPRTSGGSFPISVFVSAGAAPGQDAMSVVFALRTTPWVS